MRAFATLAALAAMPWAPALAADPPVPSGKDPGGSAVALVTSGIDYTPPDVARVLARDGEGELIGWDFVDDDRLPYAAAGGKDDTPLAKLFVGKGMRLVAVRVDLADPLSLARGAAFAGKTPASIAIVPIVSRRAEDLVPIRTVAQHLKDIVFVAVAAGEPLRPEEATALATPNVVPLTSETCAREETREILKEVLALLCLHPRTP